MRFFIIVFLVAVAIQHIEIAVIAALSVYLYTIYVDKTPWDKFRLWLTGPMTKKVQKKEKSEESGYQGFTLTKDRQEANCKEFLKPGFQDDPVWQAQVKEIHKIMDENKRRNEAERAKEEEDRIRGITK